MDYREKIEEIRHRMDRGELSYEEAEKLCAPLLREMNEKAAKIAKQFDKKHKDFTFRYLVR